VKILRKVVIFNTLVLTFSLFALHLTTAAQSISILSPGGEETSRSIAAKIEAILAAKFRIVDAAMSEAAFSSAKTENPFNMTTERSRAIGAAIGCDYFILVNSATLRRSSSARPAYYESHAAIYAVSTRTGRLIFWRLQRFEALKGQAAWASLDDAIDTTALDLENDLRLTAKQELTESTLHAMEEPPDDNTPAAKDFRPPVPYRRLKPEYTSDAFLYDVTATVDIVVDLDKDGKILRTQIERWAGYGLDESVGKAVRSMNWRPAMRSGKALPMRFLVRYNFKKIEKD
jgi:hypothetical protein